MKAEIEPHQLLELIYWARRYCDGRSTYAPSSFNDIYQHLLLSNPWIAEKDRLDQTLTQEGRFFPYAQDGMYDEEKGQFDIVPRSGIKLQHRVSDVKVQQNK